MKFDRTVLAPATLVALTTGPLGEEAGWRGYFLPRLLTRYRPIVAWLRANLPGVKFSVRDGYLPSWQARQFAELARPLDRGHGARARDLAVHSGLRLLG